MLWKNLVCFFVITASLLLGQNDRGTITGTVLDQQGSVVPNAAIIVRTAESDVEYKTVATDTGNYTVPALPAGQYSVNVQAPGFKRFTQNGIVVEVAQTARIDVVLTVGSTSETITITAEAPLLKTENAEQSTVVTTERIDQLPLNFGGSSGSVGAVRSPYSFNVLSPGVAGTGANSGTTANVNGMQASTFRVQVDGQDATSQNDIGWTSTVAQPSVDMLQEFSLQTSNFAAEYGQIGGGLYNFTTKSGTNEFHGSAYEYWTNEALNADRPFTYQNPRSRKNDFGGTVGGPVWIPKIYNGKNKTFFFFNYEVYRNTINSAGSFLTLPTAAMRNGDFSALLGANVGTDPLGRPILANAIYDPSTGRNVNGNIVTDAFPNNMIPTSRLDPVALKIQSLIPATTNSALVNNWAQLAANYKRQSVPAFKIDEILPDNSKVSFYFSKQNTSQLTSPDGLPYPISGVRVQAIYGTTARLNYDRSISPTVLWHSGVGFQRFHNPDSSPPQVLDYDAAGQLGFVGSATDPGGFPRINWPGTNALGAGPNTNFGPSNANSYYDDGLTANSTATWIKGNHSYKVGAEYRLDSWTDRNSRGSQGVLNFSPNETGLPYLQTSSIGGQTIGFAYASFLLGAVDTATVNAIQDPQWRKPAWGLFLQDTWKINSKLTLDYGLRWDWQTEGHEIHYRTSMFGPSIPNPSIGGVLGALVYEGYGAGRCNCTFSRPYPYAIAPRLGLAWQLDSKTVLRTGFGISYAQVPTYNYVTNGTLLGVGFNSFTFSSPAFGTAGANLSQGLQYDHSQLYTATLNPGLVPNPGQLNSPNYYLDPNSGRPPRIMQWTFGLQREVARNLLLEANWVGNRGAWLTPSSSSVTNTLVNLNATNPATFTAVGINPATAAGQSLLLSTFKSGIPQANGFKLPYASFPLTATLAQALRPYPQFSDIPIRWAPLGDSWYESLQIKATKRYSRGFTLNGAFTWSKAEANPSGVTNNVFNRGSNKSISSFDQPYIFNVGFTYDIPTFSSKRWVRAITGGWGIGGLLQYASGLPIATPTATANMYSLYFQNTLMNRNPGVPLYLTNPNCGCVDPNKQFVWNPAAWSNPAPGTWGSAAPYYSDFRYERRPNEQMSLGRTFRLREKMSLQIRGEFFNLFNRTYLQNPSTQAPTNPQTFNAAGVPTSGWGYINSTSLYAQPRNGQIVARFSF